MRIVFDIDGTLTDYNRFVQKRAVKYFKSKYNMEVVNADALEIEDAFDIKNTCMITGMTEEVAEQQKRKMLDKFWFSKNSIFFFLARFRKGVASYIRKLKQEGYSVEFHTSRAKTCTPGVIGKAVRLLTRFQFLINGVFVGKNSFFFYENDVQKVQGIINRVPVIAYDDKPQILELLKKEKVSAVCVDGVHNNHLGTEGIPRINSFEAEEIREATDKCIGTRISKFYQRELQSNKVFRKLKILTPVMVGKFCPVVLHSENIYRESDRGIVYAPNHRSTWDPIIITGILGVHIHWAALLRFFKGEDSIFNNSKNPVLCKITASLFNKLEYFPIERKSDNSAANNLDAIKDMNYFLKIKSKVGIFAEGTTRRPVGCDFGTFDDAFILLAKRNNAVIQPVTVTWIDEKKVKEKIVVNFGKSFLPEKMSTEEAMERFLETQKMCLQENKEWIAEKTYGGR